MIEFSTLGREKEILKLIDWDLTPQEAFEAYQIKSINAWTYRSLPDVCLFVIYVFKQEAKVILVKRTLKDSEEICEIPVPKDLLSACVALQGGDHAPGGQYAIDDAIKTWIRGQLNL